MNKLIIIASILLATTANAAGVIDDVLDRGTLRVGMSSFKPWAMQAQAGGFIGFEPDVAQRLAEDLGVELEIVPTAWDGIIPALLAGKFDLIVSGMSVTPARNLQVNFSAPYAYSGLGLAASKARVNATSSVDDFNRSEVIFALRRGASPVAFVKEKFPQAEVRQYDDEAAAIQDLVNGRADAFITSAPLHKLAAEQHPDKLFIPFSALFSQSQEAIALRKGDADSLNFLNNWVALRTADGWLQERHNYWFKGKEWESLVGGQ